MKVFKALITRELLEHRGAFLYAPAALLIALFVLIVTALIVGSPHGSETPPEHLGGDVIYKLSLGFIFMAWTGYLMVALFFYYADSFSADRRNNSLLFWKSMPQSDFAILGGKALAGITLFPLLILGFAAITGLLLYPLGFIASFRVPFLPLIGPVEMISIWLQSCIAGAIYILVTILWYAPFLGWVAGLSTLVQRWSIPLAFLIPGAIVLLEFILNWGSKSRPVAGFLSYRFDGILEDVDLVERVIGGKDTGALGLVGEIFARTDWLQLGIGLVFALLVVYFASEYRRRRIDA